MATVKRIVCLANSRKLSGRCIAGREFDGRRAGKWLRPVSAREHEEVSKYERQYEDGADPRVLDMIDIPLVEDRGHGYQSENWLLDDKAYWTKAGRAGWRDLDKLEDPASPLWINGHHTSNGLNDQIPVTLAGALSHSLRLIHVRGIGLHVFRPGADFGNPKRRIQGRFEYGGDQYWLWVTDAAIEDAYLPKGDGEYKIGDCYLTVSLGEPFREHCYKLIAAIITRELAGR